MKISKLFHWLYASLCFLPLLVAPIFALAVRSDNNFQPISITINNSSYQPKYQSNEVNNIDDLIEGNLYHFELSNFNDLFDFTFYMVNGDISIQTSDYTVDGHYLTFTSPMIYRIYFDAGDYYFYQNDNVIEYTLDNCPVIDADIIFFTLDDYNSENDFSTYISYSNYNVYEYVENTPIIYNDTDVGSQLLYTLYNTSEKYMNFDDVLNLKLINQWINTNVFNGNAPLIWTIIWHYLDYWLLLSIFWLCFDVLIYVPQLAHRWLDKASLE